MIFKLGSYDLSEIGGKAHNLFLLKEQGFNVPPFGVIPANKIEENDKLSNELKIGLNMFCRSFDPGTLFAVRSSANIEDNPEHSFAGQFDTFLCVPMHELEEKILKVSKSQNSDHIKAYLNEFDIKETVRVSVIVQEMVDADVSGVAFGIHPLNGHPNKKVINATYGLGEGLVSGELNSDSFLVNGIEIERLLAVKEEAYMLDPGKSGFVKKKVSEENMEASSLTDDQIKDISELLDTLKRFYKKPQDIEFAVKEKSLFLLQARPITVHQGEYIVWDNSNIVESYPGITTPLTYSFINKMYEAVYKQFTSLLGVSGRVIKENDNVFKNTLGLVKGRVYYNLLSWYKMLAMVPGYSINAEFMETMMGVKERFELEKEYRMSKGRAWGRIVLMVFRMIFLQMMLPGARRKFKRHLNKVMAKFSNINFGKKSKAEIIELYKEFEGTLLKKWKAPLTNDFFAMIWFGLLKKRCEIFQIGTNPNIHNDLLCGSNDIISTEPIRLSLRIADAISRNEEQKSVFMNHEPDLILNRMENGAFPNLMAMVSDYIEKFGERCIGELKLESISYAQNPVKYIALIKSYVENAVTIDQFKSNVEKTVRIKAEQEVEKAFAKKPLKRRSFKWILKNARTHVSERENLRYERTRAFGMVRKIVVELGKKMKKEGQISEERDVFYLELDEILDSGQTNFKGIVETRKKEYDAYRIQEIPAERFHTYGYNFKDNYIYEYHDEGEENDLSGIGCCPGIVEARVQVIMDPEKVNSLNGDILVTRSTDPGWVTLFPTVSGIIVEKGSLLSHSAIVSREMGIPCIVSVTGILKTLKTGDTIRMNGGTGAIEILEA